MSPSGDHSARLPGGDDPTVLQPRLHPPADDAFDAPTAEPATKRRPGAVATPPKGRAAEVKEVFQELLKRHEKKIWWLHTFYALGLGAFVATFAQKGLERARWLGLTLGAAWLIFMLFFRFFGTGAQQDFITAWPGARRRFFVMTYVLKNLFQGMLFFLLPFYWKASSWDGPTWWFVVLLGACALLSTLDLVFDRLLMRWKFLASIFYAVALFGSSTLVVPALFPNTPALTALMISGGLTVAAFWMLHVPIASMLRKLPLALFVVLVGGGIAGVYFGRRAIPPVPMHLVSGGVGPRLVEGQSRLALEIRAMDETEFSELAAVTQVQVIGDGDRLRHVWRRKGTIVHTEEETPWPRAEGGAQVIRFTSKLSEGNAPKRRFGHWTVDVETAGGQLIGRIPFEIRD